MMDIFILFRDKLIENFNNHSQNNEFLFEVDLNKDELWNLYLNSFPEGTNKIFRQRREYDCSCCKNFIRNVGNVVFIENNQMKTIWDFDCQSDVFQPVINALNDYVKSKPVTNVFITKEKSFGTKINYEKNEDKLIEWSHFYLNLPNKYIYKGRDTVDTVKGTYKTTKNVFKRTLEEISKESIEMILELINQNSLYRGNEWKNQLEKILEIQNEYKNVDNNLKDNYLWVKSLEVGIGIARLKNHSIGNLLENVTAGMDLDTAVRKYELIVAPENYKRSKPIFTKKMLQNAKEKINELGYIDSLQRRFAILDDLSINNVLFANRNVKKSLLDDDIFTEMEKQVAISPKKFSKLEEISVDKFINDVLPNANELEVYLENRLSKNFVSLITATNKDSKSMFKWDNKFSWAYTGNIADSSIKENVKLAGGDVDGILRFSIQWNDEKYNNDDLDAHCEEPNYYEIYFGNRRYVSPCSGALDVDIINPIKGKPAVENIIYTNLNRMKDGEYKMFVHCYCKRNGKDGFKAEIEFNGEIHEFNYNNQLRQGEIVEVAIVTKKGDSFTIKEKIPSSLSSREIWGLKTNQFVPVNLVSYSPNYWDKQEGIGNKHLFFMLKDCVNPELPNGFYNEYLNNELIEHRKVMEALGNKLSVVPEDKQLSGIGFSLTRKNNLIVKVKGKTERTLKIIF